MNTNCLFYICPFCFTTSETAANCHGRAMIQYDACRQTAAQSKPATDANGRLKSQAPRWFLSAVQPRAQLIKGS